MALSLSYPNQLNDLINFLSKQLNQSTSIGPILECINALLYTRNSPFFKKKTLSRRESSIIVHSPISYEVLRPCLQFYTHESQGIIDFNINCRRYSILSILNTSKSLKARYQSCTVRFIRLKGSSYPTESDSSFCMEMREKMLFCLSQPFVKPIDFSMCGTLLTCICQVFGLVEFGRVAPFLFVLQDESIAGRIHHAACLQNVILNVLSESSNSLGLSELYSTIQDIINDRKSKNMWVDEMENGESNIEKCLNLEFRYFFWLKLVMIASRMLILNI